jgi:D-glycero-D-manno-heptose 1,7-bisphosphate phosphatase
MRALFLDRDGVINENRHDHVHRPEQFRILPGVLEAIAMATASGLRVVVITNQSAVGLGQMTLETLQNIHEILVHQVALMGGRIEAVYVCSHRREQNCVCRKPRPALLHRAAAELHLDLRGSFLVGDAVSDVEVALAAGCQPVLVLTGRGTEAHVELAKKNITEYWVAHDLRRAVGLVLARHDWDKHPAELVRLEHSGYRARAALCCGT